MKHVGYFVVGEGKFGVYEYGRCFVTLEEAAADPGSKYWDSKYWESRGYEFVEVWVKE